MDEQLPIFNEVEAIRILSKRYGLHVHRTRSLVEKNIFGSTDAISIASNLEVADHYFKLYLKKKHDNNEKRLQENSAKPVERHRLTYTFKQEPPLKDLVFTRKKDIHEYLSHRYNIKRTTMQTYFHSYCVFWTNDIVDVMNDLPRADAYYTAFVTSSYVDELQKKKRKQMVGERPAYDGGFHMNTTVQTEETVQPEIAAPQAPSVEVEPKEEKKTVYKKGGREEAHEILANYLGRNIKTVYKQINKGFYWSDDIFELISDLPRAKQCLEERIDSANMLARTNLKRYYDRNKAGMEYVPKITQKTKASESPLHSSISSIQDHLNLKHEELQKIMDTRKQLDADEKKLRKDINILQQSKTNLLQAEKIMSTP